MRSELQAKDDESAQNPLSPEKLAAIKALYTPEPVPPCRVCGKTLGQVVQAHGEEVFACHNRADLPAMTIDEHYRQSKFVRSRKDPMVLILLDALATVTAEWDALQEQHAVNSRELSESNARLLKIVSETRAQLDAARAQIKQLATVTEERDVLQAKYNVALMAGGCPECEGNGVIIVWPFTGEPYLSPCPSCAAARAQITEAKTDGA